MNGPVRIGAVGLGRLGRFHAETIAHRLPNAELTAVCSLAEDELDWAQTRFPEASPFTQFDRLIHEANVHAVVLSSPSAIHCAQIMEALAAGLHVFCEKPLGVTSASCAEAAAIAQRHPHQVVMIGFMRRYDPSYLELKRRLTDGDIGRPMLFRSYSVDPLSQIEGALAYLPQSSGQFLDMAVHDFDLARWLLESEPRTIAASEGCYAHPEFADYEDGDHVGAFMQFDNDAMGFVFAGRRAAHGYHVETEVIGTEGSLRVGNVPQRNLVEVLDRGGVRRECTQGFLERFGEAYIAELSAFIRCIVEKRPAEITIHDGWRATEMALAAHEAFRNSTMVSFAKRNAKATP